MPQLRNAVKTQAGKVKAADDVSLRFPTFLKS